MVSLEFNGLGAGEIKRHPGIEILLVTRDKPTSVTKKVLNWLTQASSPSIPMSLRAPISRAKAISSPLTPPYHCERSAAISCPLTGEDLGEIDTRIAIVSTLTAVLQLLATQRKSRRRD